MKLYFSLIMNLFNMERGYKHYFASLHFFPEFSPKLTILFRMLSSSVMKSMLSLWPLSITL